MSGRLQSLRWSILAALTIAFHLISIQTVEARRVALVIGNAGYAVKPLENPGRDATAVASTFNALGFDQVTLKLDLTRRTMLDALRTFEREAASADIAVVFFAGHGTEFSARENYLVPVDATLANEADLEDEAISLSSVLRRLEGARQLRLVILDACRNPPFKLAGRKRSGTRGLARVEPEDNTLIAYATKDGTTADDGSGKNSPFTAALLRNLAKPGLDVRLMFGAVRDDVMAATGRQQQPHLYGTLGGKPIYLREGAAPAALTLVSPQAPAPASARPSAEPPVQDCDRLAAPPFNLRQLAPGIEFNNIDAEKAATACKVALASFPGTARFEAQLGRALEKSKLYDEARNWYERAAAKGESAAMYELGTLYQNGRGGPANYAAALQWYQKAAALGDVQAMAGLGMLYDLGQGVEKNFVTARGWYEKAAAQGSIYALHSLGVLYDNGEGVERNYETARDFYERAAAKGYAESMTNLGVLFERGQGVTKNPAVARSWYEKAAALDDGRAMANLGWIYEQGLGVAKSFKTARSWYEKAAAQDNAAGMNNLGSLYDLGQGVDRNFVTARGWYEKAAALGDGQAMTNLGVLYQNGEGVPKNLVTARSWYDKAAGIGNAAGMSNLGMLYEKGDGVPKSLETARSWYEKAAALDDDIARKRLADLTRRMPGKKQ